jgi:hypothetical protein
MQPNLQDLVCITNQELFSCSSSSLATFTKVMFNAGDITLVCHCERVHFEFVAKTICPPNNLPLKCAPKFKIGG